LFERKEEKKVRREKRKTETCTTEISPIGKEGIITNYMCNCKKGRVVVQGRCGVEQSPRGIKARMCPNGMKKDTSLNAC
jgi:hypothetical protein